MKKVYCNSCISCTKEKFHNTIYYYCDYNSDINQKTISVDRLPKTSPKWCPLRKGEKL